MSRAVIVATGSTARRLNAPGEKELWGSSVHGCAVCDGPLYGPGDKVLVVGGGDAAVAAAILLSRRVERVYLIHRGEGLSASDRSSVRALERVDNVEILSPYEVERWESGRTTGQGGGSATAAAGGAPARVRPPRRYP